MADIYKLRAIKKGLLTKSLNKARLLKNRGDVAQLKIVLAGLDGVFREFDDTHDTYVQTLDNTEDIDAANFTMIVCVARIMIQIKKYVYILIIQTGT